MKSNKYIFFILIIMLLLASACTVATPTPTGSSSVSEATASPTPNVTPKPTQSTVGEPNVPSFNDFESYNEYVSKTNMPDTFVDAGDFLEYGELKYAIFLPDATVNYMYTFVDGNKFETIVNVTDTSDEARAKWDEWIGGPYYTDNNEKVDYDAAMFIGGNLLKCSSDSEKLCVRVNEVQYFYNNGVLSALKICNGTWIVDIIFDDKMIDAINKIGADKANLPSEVVQLFDISTAEAATNALKTKVIKSVNAES